MRFLTLFLVLLFVLAMLGFGASAPFAITGTPLFGGEEPEAFAVTQADNDVGIAPSQEISNYISNSDFSISISDIDGGTLSPTAINEQIERFVSDEVGNFIKIYKPSPTVVTASTEFLVHNEDATEAQGSENYLDNNCLGNEQTNSDLDQVVISRTDGANDGDDLYTDNHVAITTVSRHGYLVANANRYNMLIRC